jgi:hypothetical protein
MRVPKNVRNVFVKVSTWNDGREPINSVVKRGPTGKDGRLLVEFQVRDQGKPVPSVKVHAYRDRDTGLLHLVVTDHKNNAVVEHVTER